jgi:NADPH2:quinone reductase
MRAVVIGSFGGPEVLELREVPDPQPAKGEVLVRVRASALNRADLLQRMGKYPAPAGSPADVPGLEFAGEVAAQGPGASRWRLGARVFGVVGGGAHAELLTVHEDAVAAIPANLDWAAAGAVPEAFITAHDALTTQGGLGAGETVLIHAVASGVGLAASQLVAAMGARAFGTTRSASKLETARSFGLEDGVVLGTDLSPLGPAIARWTGGRGIDLTLELVGGPYFVESILGAGLKGRIVLIGTMAGAEVKTPLGQILRKRLTIRGTALRSRTLAEKIEATESFSRDVVPLLASGAVRPVVDTVLPISRIADGHRQMESNQTTGKIVLTM